MNDEYIRNMHTTGPDLCADLKITFTQWPTAFQNRRTLKETINTRLREFRVLKGLSPATSYLAPKNLSALVKNLQTVGHREAIKEDEENRHLIIARPNEAHSHSYAANRWMDPPATPRGSNQSAHMLRAADRRQALSFTKTLRMGGVGWYLTAR
jgi:hypothetical protein